MKQPCPSPLTCTPPAPSAAPPQGRSRLFTCSGWHLGTPHPPPHLPVERPSVNPHCLFLTLLFPDKTKGNQGFLLRTGLERVRDGGWARSRTAKGSDPLSFSLPLLQQTDVF